MLIVGPMFDLALVAMIAVAAFLVAWVVNGLVGLLSGERPGGTGNLWLDIFLRFFAVLELGLIGRLLNYIGIQGLPRKVVFFVGLLCVLVFLVRACHHEHDEHVYRDEHVYHYPAQSP
jgi:hypothetical protein